MTAPLHHRGVVLLYAVLVASIILTLSLSLANIIYRQLVIAAIGKNSQRAYYAADIGRECYKLYRSWTHDDYGSKNGSFPPDIYCGGNVIPPDTYDSTFAEYPIIFSKENLCAILTVRRYDPSSRRSAYSVFGYNSTAPCEGGLSANQSLRIVERGLKSPDFPRND